MIVRKDSRGYGSVRNYRKRNNRRNSVNSTCSTVPGKDSLNDLRSSNCIHHTAGVGTHPQPPEDPKLTRFEQK